MRRWIALAAKLYPRAWRERYGAEFDALMEDVEADWRELSNVLGGAVKMQLRSGTAYVKLAAITAVAGAIVALWASFAVPERYVSTAELRMTMPQGSGTEAFDHLEQIRQEILSRNSLAELIQRPSLNLYRGRRQRIPMEDIIERMRRDIQIQRVAKGGEGAPTFSVSFSYPDRFLAQAVTRDLIRKFVETNLNVALNRASMWQRAWQETAPAGENLEVLAPASDPQESIGPNRLSFVVWGLGSGVVMGVLTVATVRQPKRAMQLAAFAIAGCALAATVAFRIPSRYISSAVMRFTPPIDPKRWYAGRTAEAIPEHVQKMAQEVLSERNLERIARKVGLNTSNLDDMRNNISVRMQHQTLNGGDPSSAFDISFACDDGRKAQAAVRELVTGFFERNIVEERERMKTAGPELRFMADHKIGDNLEVLDPASLPQSPVWPNRFVISVAGLGGGLLIGVVALYLRRPRGPLMEPVAAT